MHDLKAVNCNLFCVEIAVLPLAVYTYKSEKGYRPGQILLYYNWNTSDAQHMRFSPGRTVTTRSFWKWTLCTTETALQWSIFGDTDKFK